MKTEEQKNEFRKSQSERKKILYAEKGPDALKEANRRYQATFRAKKKMRKNDKDTLDKNGN